MIALVIGGVVILAFLVLVGIAIVDDLGWGALVVLGVTVVVMVGIVLFAFGLLEIRVEA